jgi:hypothetical protein
MSSTFQLAAVGAPTSFAIMSAGMAIMGAMACAKSTQTGWLGSMVPCALMTSPPLRTIAATSLKPSVSMGEVRNFSAVPR